jgi:hypothetical protein
MRIHEDPNLQLWYLYPGRSLATWQGLHTYTVLYRLVFLLGETNDEKDQTKLEEEAHTYGDIVQVGA